MTPENITDIPRNDVAACVAYYEAHGASPEEVSTMILLQDDPAELIEAMRDWETEGGPTDPVLPSF